MKLFVFFLQVGCPILSLNELSRSKDRLSDLLKIHINHMVNNKGKFYSLFPKYTIFIIFYFFSFPNIGC